MSRCWLSLLLAFLAPGSLAAAPSAALTTPAYDASAKFRAVHIDTLDPKLQHVFEAARLEWLKVLALHHTTDGRGYFLQRAGSTFITLRSFNSFSEYEALRDFRAGVGERIGPDGADAGERYDRGTSLCSRHTTARSGPSSTASTTAVREGGSPSTRPVSCRWWSSR